MVKKRAISLAKPSTLLQVGANPASPSTPGTHLGLIPPCLEPVQGRGSALSPHLPSLMHMCGWQQLIMGFMCDLHKFSWKCSPWDGGIFLVEPCCPLLQMPFCQQVLHGANMLHVCCVCDFWGVMKQEGKSKQQPLLHPLVLGRGLGMAGKALDMLRHQEFPLRLG